MVLQIKELASQADILTRVQKSLSQAEQDMSSLADAHLTQVQAWLDSAHQDLTAKQAEVAAAQADVGEGLAAIHHYMCKDVGLVRLEAMAAAAVAKLPKNKKQRKPRSQCLPGSEKSVRFGV